VKRVSLAKVLLCTFLLVLTSLLITGCGGGGASTGGNNPPPSGGAPTITVSADKNNVNPGDLVTLTWKTTNATSLTVAPPIGESDDIQVSDSGSVSPTQTTTYVFTAKGAGGTTQFSMTVNVKTVPPTITLTADPTSILAGQSATLSWNSENTTSVTIDGGVGAVSPTGTKVVSPTATTTYTATATGLGGTQTATATVTVATGGQLAVTLTAAPDTITAGQSSKLTWSSQGATSVTLNGTSVSLDGTQQVTPGATTQYTAVATDSTGATKSATATVTVLAANAGLQNLKHIFIYMNENRSFDNIFGMLGQYRQSKGLSADVDGLDVNQVFTTVSGAKVKPFHMQTTCMEVTSPGWNESHFYAHRKSDGTFGMDNWMMAQSDSQHSTVDPQYSRSMGYMNQTDLPYYYELATQFATSDRWFSSTMAPTIPNRMYLFTGTSFGFIRPDPLGATHPKYTQKTIFQLLNEHGITWKYYFQSGDVYLAQFDIWNDPASVGRVRNISEYYKFMADPNADKLLPQVIFIEQAASLQLNEHPDNKWGLQPGAANTKKIIDALMTSAAWATSAFVFTYDEAGGIHDHVSPITTAAPDATPPNFKDTDSGRYDTFTYSGFRTPVIVVSPWAKKNFVSHTARTTASVLKLVEARFGLPALTARDAAADDMTEFFDFSNPAWMTPPTMPAQPWYCQLHPGGDLTKVDTSCQGIIGVLGEPPLATSTCDLSHKLEVAPELR
jgi:phospholipase C